MIFQTFNSDIDKWTTKLGLLGKSFSEIGTVVTDAFASSMNNTVEANGFWGNLKKNLFTNNKDVQSQFVDVIPEIDTSNISNLTETIKEISSDVSKGKSSWQEWFDIFPDNEKYIVELAQKMEGQIITEKNLIKTNKSVRSSAIAKNEALKKQTLSAQAGQAAIQALASAGNTLIMWGISQAINGLYELSQVSDNVAQRARELSSSFTNDKSEIEGYKTQIDQLYATVNSNTSSVEEVTNARRELLNVQDEMIARFGDEKDTITLVTNAINGQTEALDTLTQKQWQEAKNEFNNGGIANNISNSFNGYSDNIDRMVDEYGNYSSRIELNPLLVESPETYAQIESLLGGFGATIQQTTDGLMFADLSGTASDVYDKLLDIQTVADRLEVNDVFTKQLTQLANAAKDIADEYSGFWEQYVLNDLILDDKTSADYFKQLTDVHKDYENALVAGNEGNQNQAIKQFSTILSSAAEKIDDAYILEYFNNMYPDLQAAVDNWKFTTTIIPEMEDVELSSLKGKTESELLDLANAEDLSVITGKDALIATMSGKDRSEKFAKQEAKAALDALIDKAVEYGICVDGSAENTQKLIDMLVEAGIIQRDLSAQPPIVEQPKWDYSTTLQNLDSMKETMSVLDNIYTELMESGGQISFDSLSSLNAAFSDLDNAEDYIKRIQEAGADMDTEAAASAIEDLMGAYLSHSDVLNNVTEENQSLITSMLEEMGILNAEELVLSSLNQALEIAALEKQFLAENGYELANASLAEASQFIYAANASNEAKMALARFALEKMNANNTPIDTSADIANILYLAETAEISAETLKRIQNAKSDFASGNPILQSQARSTLDSILEKGFDWSTESSNKEGDKSKTVPRYAGSSRAAKTFADAQKNLAKSTDSASDAVNRQNEALQKQKEALEDSKKELEDVYNAVQWFYDKQIDSIDKSIDKLEEANKALEKQKEHYDSILSVVDDVYDEEIGRIKDRMDAMDKSNETAEKELALEKAKQALEDARNRKTLRTYSKGRGFVYTADEAAVRQAEDDLATATEEQVKSRLQDQIDLLEEWKNKWAEIPKAYEKAMDEMAAMEMFGPNYKDFILNSTDSDINRFKNDYTGFQLGMDANDARIDAYQKQKEKLEELKSLWEDSKNAYRDSQYQSHLSSYFGSNYEYQLLHNSATWRAQYASQYADVCRQLEEVEKKLKNNHLSGSSRSGNAYAKGHRGISHSEKALVGESGPEILVRNGVFQTIDNPQLMDLKKGDIIFNHEQTRAILSGSSSFNASGRQAFQHFKETALAKHSMPYSRALSQPLLNLPAQNRTENTVLQFHGDLSFPNITSGNDARRLVSELENLSLKAGQRAGKR